MGALSLIDTLASVLRDAGAKEDALATLRAQFDQLLAEYRDEGVPRDKAVAFATVMLVITAMQDDPGGALMDALAVSAKQNPKLPLLALAVIMEALE